MTNLEIIVWNRRMEIVHNFSNLNEEQAIEFCQRVGKAKNNKNELDKLHKEYLKMPMVERGVEQ